MKIQIAFLLFLLSFQQASHSAQAPAQQFCPLSPVRTYLDITAQPEAGELGAHLYKIENNLRKPVQGGLVYIVETKNPSSGPSSTSACYMVTGIDGTAAFAYDPAFSGCYNGWLIYCPNGAAALQSTDAGKTVRQMCLDKTGVLQSEIDGNLIQPCSPTGTPSNQQANLLSHNEFSFCNYSPAGLQQLCWPVLLIFGLLIGASFAAGRNPFAAFDLSAPRMSRGRQYSMRQQSKSFDYMSYAMGATSLAQSAGQLRDKFRKEKKELKHTGGKVMYNKKTGKMSVKGGKWEMVGTGKFGKDGEGTASNWGRFTPLGLVGMGLNAAIGQPLSKLIGKDMKDLKEQEKIRMEQKQKEKDLEQNKKIIALVTGIDPGLLERAKKPGKVDKVEEMGRKFANLKGEQGSGTRFASARENVQYMAGDLWYGLKSFFGPMSKNAQDEAALFDKYGPKVGLAMLWRRILARATLSNLASVLIEASFRSSIGGRMGSYLFGTMYYVDNPERLPIGLSVLAESIQMVKASAETNILMEKVLKQMENGVANSEPYKGGKTDDGQWIFTGKDGSFILVDSKLETSTYQHDDKGWYKLDANNNKVDVSSSELAKLVGLSGTVEMGTLVNALQDRTVDTKNAVYIKLDWDKMMAEPLKKAQYLELLGDKSDYAETFARLMAKINESGMNWKTGSEWETKNLEKSASVFKTLGSVQKEDFTAEGTTKLGTVEKDIKKELVDALKECGLDKLATYVGDINTKEGLNKAIGIVLERTGDQGYNIAKHEKTEGEYIAKMINNGEMSGKIKEAGDLYELGAKAIPYIDSRRLEGALQNEANERDRLFKVSKDGAWEEASYVASNVQMAKDDVNAAFMLKMSHEGGIEDMVGNYLSHSDSWRAQEIEKLEKRIEAEHDKYNDATNDAARREVFGELSNLKTQLELCKTADSYGDYLKEDIFTAQTNIQHSADFFQKRAELSHMDIAPESWNLINRMDPNDEKSTETLNRVEMNLNDTRGMENWAGTKGLAKIEHLKELQNQMVNTILDPSTDENSKVAMEVLWGHVSETINDAKNQEISPEKMNNAGLKAMDQALNDFEEQLKEYTPEKLKLPETLKEIYLKAYGVELKRFEENIRNGGYDKEDGILANNTLSEMKNTRKTIESCDPEKLVTMRTDKEDPLYLKDPLTSVTNAISTFDHASQKFKDRQLYEHQDALMAPHYNQDVPELKRMIENGEYAGINTRDELQRMKDKDYVENLKRVRDELGKSQDEDERPIYKSDKPYKKYNRPE